MSTSLVTKPQEKKGQVREEDIDMDDNCPDDKESSGNWLQHSPRGTGEDRLHHREGEATEFPSTTP